MSSVVDNLLVENSYGFTAVERKLGLEMTFKIYRNS